MHEGPQSRRERHETLAPIGHRYLGFGCALCIGVQFGAGGSACGCSTCAGSSHNSAGGAAESGGGGQLKVAMRTLGNPQGLPGQASGGTGDTIPGLIGLMESLTERKAKDLLFYPHLAESYDVATDLSKITVKLREGVQFHHGWGEMGRGGC